MLLTRGDAGRRLLILLRAHESFAVSSTLASTPAYFFLLLISFKLLTGINGSSQGLISLLDGFLLCIISLQLLGLIAARKYKFFLVEVSHSEIYLFFDSLSFIHSSCATLIFFASHF